MPDEKGVSRRERVFAFGDASTLPPEIPVPPDVEVPPEGDELWGWYWSISNRLRRVQDGVCLPVPPSEFLAWCTATGTIIYAVEYDILCGMDEAFCTEMNSELQDYRVRQQEQQKAELAAAKSRR